MTACYLDHVKAKHSTVVVSQSWNEILAVNEQIRLGLKRAKLVDDADTTVTTYQPVDLTHAQKRDPRSYDADTVLVFNRQVRGFQPGDAGRVLVLTDTHLLVEGDTRVAGVPFKHLDRVTVCQRKELALATGDRLQLKANGRSEDGRNLANGELVTVKRVQSDGRIELSDGRVLGKAFRQLVRGYAVTSYAAQGKTVDYVLFSDSAVTAATSRQQWYVTVSRGRKGVHIFTTDKTQLRENITRSGDRLLAVEIVKPWERKSLSLRLPARRFGVRAARIFERTKHARIARELRERAARHRAQTQLVRPSIKPKQTQGIHV